MSTVRIVPIVKVGGVDPGLKPGLVVLHIGQPDGRLLRVERSEHLTPELVVEVSDYVAVEAYVRGPKSAKSRDTNAQRVTEAMAYAVRRLAADLGKTCQALPAGSVKPWATDDRLRAYPVGVRGPELEHLVRDPSLYVETRGGGGHDRDAARHALNLAVKLGLLPRR